MYLHYIPSWIQAFYPSYTWNIPTLEKQLFLTFDDGPVPEDTEWVLDVLCQYNAKATFFWVGENVRKYPFIARKVLQEGHSVGNHTQHHLNGRKHGLNQYLENIESCQRTIYDISGYQTTLFRPPYGRMTKNQIKEVGKSFHLIMMDVISGDFDLSLQEDRCYEQVKKNTQKGSIILFHDSQKSRQKLRYSLPKVLSFFQEKGFQFNSLAELF